MIPSSPCFRRGSALITQLDFEDILNIDRQELMHQATTMDRSQVVPDLDGLQDGTLDLQKDFTDLHFTWPRIAVNMNTSQADLFSSHNESYPRSPFLPRTSISEIDNMGLLSPLFSLSNTTSPALKTPSTLYEICCSSRKPSDDLSIYLPDNFTPASLESLDKSINRTVFQFPSTIPKIEATEDSVFIEDKSENSPTSSGLNVSTNNTSNVQKESKETVLHDDAAKPQPLKNLADIASVKEKRAKNKRKYQGAKTDTAKRKKACQNNDVDSSSQTKEPSPVFRNKMERERRNDLNNRFQMLRDTMPDHVTKDSISKIAILKTAAVYVKELLSQEQSLEELSQAEKKRNEELLRKLVDVNHNISGN